MSNLNNTRAPIRIQRKRTKGWKMPPNTVYVGRPTKWGNPFVLKGGDSHEIMRAVKEYRHWLTRTEMVKTLNTNLAIRELRGKNLACFCPLNQPCHADVLLEIANGKF